MREQEEGGLQAAGRRGGVVRALLGLGAITEGAAAAAAAEGRMPRKAVSGDGGGEERKAVVRVVAADMPPALQRRAFRCARDELAGMPHSTRRLEPKRLALALKKEFDTAYGPAWHCIVGTSFGSYVTHARGGRPWSPNRIVKIKQIVREFMLGKHPKCSCPATPRPCTLHGFFDGKGDSFWRLYGSNVKNYFVASVIC
uniref:Dynein light chain n=1 Tax=Oryza punctata TaxID=4537 RepID=A0A0E0K4X2_ORYPU